MPTSAQSTTPLDRQPDQPPDHAAARAIEPACRADRAAPLAWAVLDHPGVNDHQPALLRPDLSPGRSWAASHADPDPIGSLRTVLAGTRNADCPPFASGWIGLIRYDVGRVLEPRAAARTAEHLPPAIELHRFDSADLQPVTPTPADAAIETPRLALSSFPGRAAYLAACRAAIDLIRVGDVYQVNLAHCLRGSLPSSADPRAFARGIARKLFAIAQPRHGAFLDLPSGETIISLSPERFLTYDATTRRVTTRPMKGTRPTAAGAAAELDAATKDRAELAMIVDLMRNDIGRVADFGSMAVDAPRTIETHGTVVQATATVSGTLREGLDVVDLLAATLPAGSITGAPKIRAMQIIDELEPFTRGPWCGSVVVIDDAGRLDANVAIRTAIIRGHEFEYPVGAGIVADSNPEAEWAETLVKASVLAPVADIVP
ncbi:MAG: anthranilate synthase component I family protein [Planctomycetota bacterium]